MSNYRGLPEPDGITEMLNAAKDPQAISALIQHIYPNLWRLAAGQLGGHAPGRNIGPTELVNESYQHLRRALLRPELNFENRKRFFAYAATIMRRVRSRMDQQAAAEEVLNEALVASDASPLARMMVDIELQRIAQTHPQRVAVFELQYYTGLKVTEAAEVAGCTLNQAKTWIAYVRAALAKRFRESAEKDQVPEANS